MKKYVTKLPEEWQQCDELWATGAISQFRQYKQYVAKIRLQRYSTLLH